ncbi:IMPACT family protein [Treponema brennaborense]|uniref:Uncharacterized protein family UPF0029, Impact, N-terminal protein n=1 Tax=Treponema brennaborense (strain DSM 12168 / CIP 105900 / DD5/3) TaxID=906968 RepID=F4LJ63_TREBD|nr:YigZ family protein [Treponema brennaborense]AEE16320.1 Uncharacterized protein family UPF0029, Impact, N-terminal protein [Treponema brennaborense DSM 12168]
MDVLVSYACAELEIKNSRFLAEVFPVASQNAARETLKAQKLKYADATHVVHAFAVGNAAETLGMSDDGEPAGTAGRPVLDVLKGRKCTNVLLTVTRWFGGTLLGTGGLVRAYGDSAKAVLAAAVFEPLAVKCRFSFAVPYDAYELVKRFLSSLHTDRVDEVFTTEVAFSGFVHASEAGSLRSYLTDLTNGKTVPVFTDAEPDPRIPPQR